MLTAMKSKSYFILTLLLLLSVQLNAGWQRPVTNYTRHTYKAGNQNWMLQQHDNGWMYVVIVTVYSNLTVQAGIFTLYVMQRRGP